MKKIVIHIFIVSASINLVVQKFEELALTPPLDLNQNEYKIRDLYIHQNLNLTETNLTAEIGPHDMLLIKLYK
jgi:hypothetical protein